MTNKKMLSTLLAAILLATVSCGGTPSGGNETTPSAATDSGTTTEETAAPDPLSSLRKEDFGGRAYTMLGVSDSSMSALAPNELNATELNGDIVNDTVYNRNRKIEDIYNVKITAETKPSGEIVSLVKSSVLAGDCPYDLVWPQMSGGSTLATSGVLANFYDFKDIDLTAEWWNQRATEQLTVNGKCYLQLNYIPYTGMLFTHCMFYNHRLAEKYLTESMYDLVRNGKWTIDKFLEVTENATQDINGDSKYDENDNYGFMASFGSVGIFTYSCDQDMVSVSKDGEVKIEIYTEKMQDIVEKVNKLCYEGNRSYVKPVAKEPDIAKMFANGQSLFYAGFLSDALLYFRDMKDDYGMLPFPKYDENQEHYYTSVSGGTGMLGIPLTVADPDFTGLITEALAIESYNSVRPAIYETVMENKLLRDEDSVEMYETLLDGIRVEFAVVYHSSNSDIPFTLWNLTEKKSTDLASYINSRGPKALKAYQKIVDAWYE